MTFPGFSSAAVAVAAILLLHILAVADVTNKVHLGHIYNASTDESCALLQNSVRPMSPFPMTKRHTHGNQKTARLADATSHPATVTELQANSVARHDHQVLDSAGPRASSDMSQGASALTLVKRPSVSGEGSESHAGMGWRSTFMLEINHLRNSSVMAQLQWAAEEIKGTTWTYYALATLIAGWAIIFAATCAYGMFMCVFQMVYQCVDFVGEGLGVDVLPDWDGEQEEKTVARCC